MPFLVYRDARRRQRILAIAAGATELWVGRRGSADIRLDWDEEVSGLHAQIELVRDECTLVDDGLSRNGSFVNGERVRGRRHLRDQDMIRFGQRSFSTASGRGELASTVIAGESPRPRRSRPASGGCSRPLPAVQGRRRLRHPGDQPADRRGASPQRRRGQDPPAGAVREVRSRGAAAEPEAGRTGRAGAAERADLRARPLASGSTKGWLRPPPRAPGFRPWPPGSVSPPGRSLPGNANQASNNQGRHTR